MFSDFFSIFLIIFYLFLSLFIYLRKFYNLIYVVLICSSIVQIFDKPFFVQVELSDVVGLSFIFFRFKDLKSILLRKSVLLYSVIFMLPIVVGSINVLFPFEFTSMNLFSRFEVFLKASLRVVGMLGSLYFLLYILSMKDFVLERLVRILLYSFLVSAITSLVVYSGLMSPYSFFKGASYTPNGGVSLYDFRLSGLCYEPRMLGYFSAFTYFLWDTLRTRKFLIFFLKIFSILILVLTFSISGMMFFLFLYILNYLVINSIGAILKNIFTLTLFILAIGLIFYEHLVPIIEIFVKAIDQRFWIDKDFDFRFQYFPAFLSSLERHDLPVIFYLDQNLSGIFLGFGYGLTRIFMGPYSWVSDFGGEGYNLQGTVTCCEAHVGFVYFLGVGGLVFLLLWLWLYARSVYSISLYWGRMSGRLKSFFTLMLSGTFFMLFQIPQSSIVLVFYFVVFNSELILKRSLNEQ